MQQLPWVLNWMEVQHRSVQPIPQQHRRSKRVNKANSRNVMQSVGRVWRPDRLCQTGMCRCSGFIIHTEALHLGASPDGKVNETNENLHLVMLRWIAPLKKLCFPGDAHQGPGWPCKSEAFTQVLLAGSGPAGNYRTRVVWLSHWHKDSLNSRGSGMTMDYIIATLTWALFSILLSCLCFK